MSPYSCKAWKFVSNPGKRQSSYPWLEWWMLNKTNIFKLTNILSFIALQRDGVKKKINYTPPFWEKYFEVIFELNKLI